MKGDHSAERRCAYSPLVLAQQADGARAASVELWGEPALALGPFCGQSVLPQEAQESTRERQI